MAKAPPGYLDLTEAGVFVGYTKETVRTAAVKGDLKGLQRVPHGPWYFLAADLRRWRGMDEPAESVAS